MADLFIVEKMAAMDATIAPKVVTKLLNLFMFSLGGSDSSCEKLLKMISDYGHRDKERFAVDGDSDGMVFDLVGACHTISREGTGMLVATELTVILRSYLLGPLDQLNRVPLE